MPTIRRVHAAVTGGAGFIGSNLVDVLVARGDEVTVIDDLSFGRREYVNDAARFIAGDIRDGIDLAGIDVVFHLAAQTDVQTSVREPARDADLNVVGTVRVAEAALAAGTKIVFTSTGGAIYGECPAPATEDAPRQPLSPYGIAKLCAEEYLDGFNRIHGSNHVVARLGNVFGPRQGASLEGGVVSIFLDRLARGEQAVIFGDGLQVRDFVFVGDVAAALLAAAEHAGGIFNVGSGVETSVLELYAACAEAAGVATEPVFEPARLGDLRRSALDVSRAAEVLGFRASVPLAEGIARTLAWATE
jgi:UDP-glucose 4-epimerase